MANTYPKRPHFFSNRFLRVLAKACAAQEIGQGAVCLLMTIAVTEDAKRYTGTVTFFNAQLMAAAGFRSEEALATARNRAIEAGWLHYEPGGKHVAGRYWVTIPERLEVLDDAPMGEGGAIDRDQPPSEDGALIESPSTRSSAGRERDDSGLTTGVPAHDPRQSRSRAVGERLESGSTADHSNLSLSLSLPLVPNAAEPPRDDVEQDITTPSDVPRGTKNDMVDPVHGLGVWIRWHSKDRNREDENAATVRELVATYGAVLVQRVAERLRRVGSVERDRKPGDKCWPDELLPEILRDQAATTATATPAPATVEDLPPIVRQAHALVALHGDDAARSALGWTTANAPTRRSILEAANRLAVAQELVDHLAALPPPDGNLATRIA